MSYRVHERERLFLAISYSLGILCGSLAIRVRNPDSQYRSVRRIVT